MFLARDLINTPPNDMGPEELADAARDLAKKHGAKFSVDRRRRAAQAELSADPRRRQRLGRARRVSSSFSWGRADAPKVTLVGKGVCFDTGGYDLKPASGMASMKKDMGGAATVLAIADMVMGAKLDVRLRVLIPAAENSVSGTAYRPERRVSAPQGPDGRDRQHRCRRPARSADALTEADSETPELLIDIATLTGAARTATGIGVAAILHR